MNEDWRDLITVQDDGRRDYHWWRLFGHERSTYDRKAPPGGFVLRRRKRRKLRRRYIVLEVGDCGRLYLTNAEVRYRKSKKVWTIFIDDKPVKSYHTLIAARMALMPGPLDRMAAEVDASCLDTSDSVKSSTDVPSSQQT